MKHRFTLVILMVAGLALASAGPAISAQPAAAPSTALVRNYIRSSACSPTGITTTFALPSAAEMQYQYEGVPSQIWIDLSVYPNGFAPGTFIGAGPFAAGASSSHFDWNGMIANVKHYYRVNALFPDGWKTIGSETLTTPDCARILRYDCPPGVNTVTMQWNIPAAAGITGSTAVEQWVDITVGSARFLGAFAAAGPLPATGTTFTWPGIVAQRQHNYRINARYTGSFNGWRIQGTGMFVTPDCRLTPAAG